MANGEHDSAEFHTNLFGFKLAGKDALSIFLFIVVLASMALTIWEHGARSIEHDNIICMIKLNLYTYTIPKGEPFDWSKMPVDLYNCVPRFLYESQRPLR